MSRHDQPPRDPKEQSDDELDDMLARIDPKAYPDRYRSLRDEYVRRHGDRVNGQPVDDYFERARHARPFAERSRFKKRMLVALAVWSLLMLAVKAVIYLTSQRPGR